MKKIIIILDGLSDLPYRSLNNKTPLEAAKTPNLDYLAKNGKCGIMYPISKTIAPESDQSMLTLLGYNIFKYYTGRGPLEAYGSNKKFKKNDLILRCNFAPIKNNILTRVRYPFPNKNIIKRINKINKEIKLIHTVGYRSVLITKGSSYITNSHPGYRIVKNFVTTALPIKTQIKKEKKIKARKKEATATAKKLNNFISETKKILKNKTLITRGAGNSLPKLKKLKGSWGLLADMPVEIAIGKLTGMKIIQKPKDPKKAAQKIIKNLKKFNNIYVQIKGPDKYGHEGLPIKKKESIESLDKKFFDIIKKLKNTLIIVTADHSTPCKLMAHSKHPVPLLIYGKGTDKVSKFSEKACKKGSIGKIKGINLFKTIQNL